MNDAFRLADFEPVSTPARRAERAPSVAPSEADARAALELLRRFGAASPEGAAALGLSALAPQTAPAQTADGALARVYDADFRPDAVYKASMPDLQNGPSSLIKGARRGIQHVGIAGFRMPLAYRLKDGGALTLETSVTGSVSLEADKKGINMSRIMRSFYAEAGEAVDFDRLAGVIERYLDDLESLDARVALSFRHPLLKPSLRSGLDGWQYYDVSFEVIRRDGETLRAVHLDYVYSSTCPCSLELSEHARASRGRIATPHSQRSVARISVALTGEGTLWVEDLVALCRDAIPTETQVMVKREDEQAFAELNGANPIFVEDAVRLLAEAMDGDARIGDYRVAASHQESLHSHDAVSVLSQGATFDAASLDPRFFETLIHKG